MSRGSFREWSKIYVDMMRGDYTQEEQAWVGRFLLFMLMEAHGIVDHCRESGKALPPILKSPRGPDMKTLTLVTAAVLLTCLLAMA